MPDVIGLRLDNAERLLFNAGLPYGALAVSGRGLFGAGASTKWCVTETGTELSRSQEN